MSKQEIIYKVQDNIACLTLNKESKSNSLSPRMIDSLHKGLDRAEEDNSVRAVGITGTGDKVFCSGADLVSSMGAKDPLDIIREYARLLKKMNTFSKPLVARVNGHCLAGGLGLMLSCDIVYAHHGAEFGTPEVRVGLFPMMIAALLLRNVTCKKALEMIYTARRYSASEAENMGLITRYYGSMEELDKAVNETLQAIASHGTYAIRSGRRALAVARDLEYEEALDYLSEQLGMVLASDEAKEGLKAFIEKRKPEWNKRE